MPAQSFFPTSILTCPKRKCTLLCTCRSLTLPTQGGRKSSMHIRQQLCTKVHLVFPVSKWMPSPSLAVCPLRVRTYKIDRNFQYIPVYDLDISNQQFCQSSAVRWRNSTQQNELNNCFWPFRFHSLTADWITFPSIPFALNSEAKYVREFEESTCLAARLTSVRSYQIIPLPFPWVRCSRFSLSILRLRILNNWPSSQFLLFLWLPCIQPEPSLFPLWLPQQLHFDSWWLNWKSKNLDPLELNNGPIEVYRKGCGRFELISSRKSYCWFLPGNGLTEWEGGIVAVLR